MKKKLTKTYRRPWFLWIGGACFLVGSLVAGSVGLASSAPGPTVSGTVTANQGTPGSSSWPVSSSQSGTWQQEITDGTNVIGTPTNPLRTDPTGSTTQPVSGTVGLSSGSSVGISGALPAGSNDIGTVHVAAPTPFVVSKLCTVPTGTTECTTQAFLNPGTLLNTASVSCTVAPGHRFIATVFTGNQTLFDVSTNLESSGVAGVPGSVDSYAGTLTNLGIPVQSGNEVAVTEDYLAAGNGAACNVLLAGTS